MGWPFIYKLVSSGLLVGIFPGKWKPARKVVGGKVKTPPFSCRLNLISDSDDGYLAGYLRPSF